MRMKLLRSTEKLFYFPNIKVKVANFYCCLSVLFSTKCQKCLEKYRSNSISYGLPHKVLILLCPYFMAKASASQCCLENGMNKVLRLMR